MEGFHNLTLIQQILLIIGAMVLCFGGFIYKLLKLNQLGKQIEHKEQDKWSPPDRNTATIQQSRPVT